MVLMCTAQVYLMYSPTNSVRKHVLSNSSVPGLWRDEKIEVPALSEAPATEDLEIRNSNDRTGDSGAMIML